MKLKKLTILVVTLLMLSSPVMAKFNPFNGGYHTAVVAGDEQVQVLIGRSPLDGFSWWGRAGGYKLGDSWEEISLGIGCEYQVVDAISVLEKLPVNAEVSAFIAADYLFDAEQAELTIGVIGDVPVNDDLSIRTMVAKKEGEGKILVGPLLEW